MNDHILSIWYVSDTASHFISIISLNSPNSPMGHYYPHLTDVETKAE